jgi:hypothetical protein
VLRCREMLLLTFDRTLFSEMSIDTVSNEKLVVTTLSARIADEGIS